MEKSEVEKFFDALPGSDQQIGDSLDEKPAEKPVTPQADDDDADQHLKNRRERRLQDKLDRERESAIALNERVKELAEIVEGFKKSSASPLEDKFKQVFGDDERGVLLTKNFAEIMQSVKQEAKLEALQEIESRSSLEKDQEKVYSDQVDQEFEYLEDTYGVDLSSDSQKAVKTRNEFIDFMIDISPKDENGDIVEYADFDAGFKAFSKTQTKPESRNKELAARTMTNSHSSSPSSGNDDATERWLNENGIRTRINRR